MSQKIVFSPSNYRTAMPTTAELLVPTIFMGMRPLPLRKGVISADSIGVRGISGGGAVVVKTTSSPASSQGSGAGSIKGLELSDQRGARSVSRKASGSRGNKGVLRGNNTGGTSKVKKAKKKARGKIAGRGANGQFKKKG